MTFAKVLRGAAIAVPVVGLVELALSLYFAARTPKTADWNAARERVASLRSQVDGAVVAPWWAEPHARRSYGEAILPLRDVARPDETRYATLLEISATGERLPETAAWRVRSEETAAHGVVLRILENPAPARVLADFVDRVNPRQADVSIVAPGRVETCSWSEGAAVMAPGLFGHPTLPAKRFVCGRQPWVSVAATVHEDQNYRARRCIWSHPPEAGALVTRFRDVPLGGVIRGHLSIHWTLEREKRGAPVELDVDVDGQRIGTAHHEDGDGWRAFELPLGTHANTTAREVAFHVRSASANERHVCWEADSR